MPFNDLLGCSPRHPGARSRCARNPLRARRFVAFFRSMVRFISLVLIGSALVHAAAAQDAPIRPQVPVIIGGHADYDSCGGTGVVVDLDPHGDGFLAVKSGPGLSYPRIDKLYNGE